MKCAGLHAFCTKNTSQSQTFSSTPSVLILWIQPASRHFANCLTYSSSVIYITKSAIHASDAADSPWLLGNVPQPERPSIEPDLKAAFLLHHLPPPPPPPLPPTPPLYHFHPRSAFVDSCPKWVCVWARVCVPFYYDIPPPSFLCFFPSADPFDIFCCKCVGGFTVLLYKKGKKAS